MNSVLPYNSYAQKVKDPRLIQVHNDIKNTKLNTENPAVRNQYTQPDYDYDKYVQKYIKRTDKVGQLPTIKLQLGERPTGDPNKFAKALCDLDHTWLIGDLNLTQINTRTRRIVMTINKYVHSSENLLILGNLLAPNFYRNFSIIMEFMTSISTENVFLILGDTDRFSIQTYMDMGFKYVTDRAEKTVNGKKVIYTYYPVPVNGQYNIFGYSNAYSGNVPLAMGRANHFLVQAGDEENRVYSLRDIMNSLNNGGGYYGSYF